MAISTHILLLQFFLFFLFFFNSWWSHTQKSSLISSSMLSFCSSLHGSELLVNSKTCENDLKQLSVCYHAALKKVLGIPKFNTNRFARLALNTCPWGNLKIPGFVFAIKYSIPCSTSNSQALFYIQFSVNGKYS